MGIQIITEEAVTRPVPDKVTSSILDHATVAEIDNFGMRNNKGLWPSYNCLDTLIPTEICPAPEQEPQKNFSFVNWVPAFEFAVHAGVQCAALGLDKADQKAEVERVFRLNEGKGVEQALLATRFVATESDDPVQWDAPEDITPGSAITLPIALALLEGHAAKNYAGLPTIHMPRAAASLLNERIIWKGDEAFTRMGSKVAIGGGYDEQDLGDGVWDLYATGEVFVERSDEISVQSFVLPGDGSGLESGMNGLADNTMIALVERMYRVGVDCYTAKISATVF